MAQVYARSCFVQGVDSLVGEHTVCGIALCQFDTSLNGFVTICHVMMVFVALFDIAKDLCRFFCSSGLYEHLLETAFQSSVLLDGIAVFVESRCANALYGTPGKSRLHDVGCIHASRSRTGTNQRMDLVDEDDDVRILLEFLQQGFDALLKLSAVFCSGHDTCHVETYYALVEQHR